MQNKITYLLLILLSPLLLLADPDGDITGENDEYSDSVLWEDLSDPFAGMGSLREWSQPKFPTSEGFEIPLGLEPQVKFWKKIYSEYSQDQGVLHDSENLEIVYEIVSFSDINRRSDINKFRKEWLRKKRVDEAKKKIISSLTRLEKTRGKSATLNPFDLGLSRLWGESKQPIVYKRAAKQVRFQLGQRDKIVQGIYFSGRYLDEFERIFKAEGLPLELTRLPFVESSFNVMARSRVGASGLWQLMPSVVNKKEKAIQGVDIRNYPNRAAGIAARVLKANYKMLKHWPLAVTGYNHGPTGVSKLADRCKSRELIDLADIKKCKGKRLGFASRNFFPSFLAVLEIERNATQYFGKVFWASAIDGTEIQLPKSIPIDIIRDSFEGNTKAFQLYNPHFLGEARRGKMQVGIGAPVMVPNHRFNGVREAIAEYTVPAQKKRRLRGQQ